MNKIDIAKDNLPPRMVATVLFNAKKLGLIASWKPVRPVASRRTLYEFIQKGHAAGIQFTKGGAVREIARLLERDLNRPEFPFHSRDHRKLLDALSACASFMEDNR